MPISSDLAKGDEKCGARAGEAAQRRESLLHGAKQALDAEDIDTIGPRATRGLSRTDLARADGRAALDALLVVS